MLACPLVAELDSFLDGTLSTESALAIEQHTNDCRTCLTFLSQRALNPQLANLMTLSIRDQITPEERQFVERVHTFLHQMPELPRPARPWKPRPTWVGNYHIIRKIASGGMATVYEAMDSRIGRRIALKMLRLGEDSQEILSRLQREAELLAKLNHPDIVTIYEAGEHEGDPYLALEYVPDGTLADLTKRRPQDPKESARLLLRVCSAIQAAHDQGILHRDLKPTNILLVATKGFDSSISDQESLDDFIPKLADFGLGRNLNHVRSHTSTGKAIGTPSYMSPEQALARSSDHRADIYGLGAILYELLTGLPPFQATDPLLTLKMVIESDPVPPRTLQPKTPRDIETICLKCLEKEPGRRYPSANELAADLQRFVNGDVVVARPISKVGRVWRYARRNPSSAAAMLGVVTMLLIIVLASTTFAVLESRLRREADEQRTIAEETTAKFEKHTLRTTDQLRDIWFRLKAPLSEATIKDAINTCDIHLLAAYESYLEIRKPKREWEKSEVESLLHAARICRSHHDTNRCERFLKLAEKASAPILAKSPGSEAALDLHSHILMAFADLYFYKIDKSDWLRTCEQILTITKRLHQLNPKIRRHRLNCEGTLRSFETHYRQLGEFEKAEEYKRQADALPDLEFSQE
jgi:serine/threonine protein kinase